MGWGASNRQIFRASLFNYNGPTISSRLPQYYISVIIPVDKDLIFMEKGHRARGFSTRIKSSRKGRGTAKSTEQLVYEFIIVVAPGIIIV